MLTEDPRSSAAPSATITRCPRRIQVLFGGHLLADSGDVLAVRDAGEAPVLFFPRRDVEMAVLQENDLRSRSAIGEARSFTIMRDRTLVEDFAFGYAQPEAGYGQLAGRIAFRPEHVDFHETDIPADAAVEPASFDPADRAAIDDAVRHTDSGSGFSQEATWEPTVSEPERPDPDKPYSGVGAI